MRTRLTLLVLLALAGCRAAPSPPSAPDGFPSELAQPATSLSPGAGSSTMSPTAGGGGATPGVSPRATTASPAPAMFSERGRATDAVGDAGDKAPAYSDLVRVTIESDGTNARVTVTMRAAVPNPMPADEQMAVGVDLFRSSDALESDYQLYATGNEEGWVAFLDTPKGFVKYPGTFQIGGARLVFAVPWSSLGGLRSGHARTFMDWDRAGVVLKDVGQDGVPDSGRFRYR